MTHDGDQNKSDGDVGEVCTTFSIPSPNLSITKTADASLGECGRSDRVHGRDQEHRQHCRDERELEAIALPAGSGSGVTWAIDNATGTPANFVLSGSKGSQTLGLASTTIPVGADYDVHITAETSATECGKYDNTATLTSTELESACGERVGGV